MERLDEIIAAVKGGGDVERLQGIPELRTLIAGNVTRMSWFVYVITLDEGINRNKVMYRLQKRALAANHILPPFITSPT